MKGDNKDKVSESGLIRKESVKGEKISENAIIKIPDKAVGEKSEIKSAEEEKIQASGHEKSCCTEIR